uniref:C-type lectin domain-containing protein n=1 Tax=Terrapene triunguis TaxID=2587831 RepID=A0A674JUR5_9SAUR
SPGNVKSRSHGWLPEARAVEFELMTRVARTGIVGYCRIILEAIHSRPPPWPPAASWCPDGWFRIQGKCCYFSKTEGNWTYSQSFCSSHAASLAGIESPQELGSLLPYKGKLDHWIGLRKDTGQVWKWVMEMGSIPVNVFKNSNIKPQLSSGNKVPTNCLDVASVVGAAVLCMTMVMHMTMYNLYAQKIRYTSPSPFCLLPL